MAALRALRLAAPADEEQPAEEEVVLAALAARLQGAGAAAALPALLAAQLPPQDGAELLPPPLPADAALLRARALALRPCEHLGCTIMGGAGGKPPPRGLKCAGCHAVRYDSVACQAADRPAHKAACRALAAQRQLRQQAAG